MRRHAFTIAELLVVIGIIVLLLAILFPSIHQARESARSLTCAGNVRAVVGAMLMYATDNEGVLPQPSDTGTVWNPSSPGYISYFYPRSPTGLGTDIEFMHGAFMKYLGELAARQRAVRCPDADAGTANYSYVLPSQLKDQGSPVVRLPQVVHPESKIILVEMNGVTARFDGHFNINEGGTDGDEPANHHLRSGHAPVTDLSTDQGYGNHGFADGHVESRSRSDVDKHLEWFNLLQ